jgi:hypothetical protein
MTKKVTTKKPVKTVVKEKDTFAFRQVGQNLLITINNVTETLKVADKAIRDNLKAEISSLVEKSNTKTKAALNKIISNFKVPAKNVEKIVEKVVEKKAAVKKTKTTMTLEDAKKMLEQEGYTVAKATTYPTRRSGEY